MNAERLPLLYDADCGFCRVSLALVLAWDRERRLRPVELRSAEADALLTGMPEDERMASWHLALPGKKVRSGGAAFAPLLAELPGGAPLARLADRFPAAAERAYRWTADRRSLWGRALPSALKKRAERTIRERS